MKSIKIILTLLFISVTAAYAQKPVAKTDTIQVNGNCGMCKSTIEKAAKSAGASFALWNEDTKKLTVKYITGKTDNQKIQQAVAKSGYDTELFTAPDAAYDKLHGCCKYDRVKSDTLTQKNQQ